MSRPALKRITLVAGLLTVLSVATPTLRSAAPSEGPPNVVVILTDDQRSDTLWAMPNVRNLLAQHGVRFMRAFVPLTRSSLQRSLI